MEPEVNEIPTRRAWAPFVGAALAMLTTGSLVVFALVAQRTSLDGFSNERVAAARPAAGTPPAISIAPVGAPSPSRSTSEGGSSTDSPATVIEVASADVPAATTTFFDFVTTSSAPRGDDTVALAPGSGDTNDQDDRPNATVDSPNQRLAEERALFARGGGGDLDHADSADDVAGWDSRHDGKHSHKSHDAIDKSNKKSKGAKARRPGGRSHAQQASATHSSSGSSRAARHAPKAQSSPRAKQSPAPPSHSQAGGKAKGRGRGHGRN